MIHVFAVGGLISEGGSVVAGRTRRELDWRGELGDEEDAITAMDRGYMVVRVETKRGDTVLLKSD